MSGFRTENGKVNRKVGAASIGGGVGAAVGTIGNYVVVSILGRWGIELSPDVSSAITYLFTIGGGILGALVLGYYTAPTKGDGIIKEN